MHDLGRRPLVRDRGPCTLAARRHQERVTSAAHLLADLFASCQAQNSHNASFAFIFTVDFSDRKRVRESSAVGRNEPVTPGDAAEKRLTGTL
jgi:hypothetical protein